MRNIRVAGAGLFILLAASCSWAQWGPEVKLSSPDASASLNENMGRCILPDGNTLHVVWSEGKDKDRGIYYRRSNDRGATWEPAIRVSPSPSADTFPLLALSGNTLHLVFLRNNGTPNAESFYKRSVDGGKTWGPDVSLGKTKWWPGVAASGNMVYVVTNTVYADDDKNSVLYFQRSKDGGATWEPRIQVSNAPRRAGGRSEDPALMASGKCVYLVWNDNRDAGTGKGMSVYYRRSADMGATWEAETALTHAPEYTYCPTVFPAGPDVDVAFADRGTGPYEICYLHSADFGVEWDQKQQITKTGAGSVYPAVVRDGTNVHMTWAGKEGVMYQRSVDGGKTWEPAECLAPKGSAAFAIAFVTVTGDAVHVIYASLAGGRGAVNYRSNPTGNKHNP